MKLIVVMGIEEDADRLRQLFRDYNVPVYSESPIRGFKHQGTQDEAGNWFAVQHPSIYSQLLFTFVEDQKAEEVMTGIRTHRARDKSANPIRAFQLSVEDHV
jgi:hypothetical protein